MGIGAAFRVVVRGLVGRARRGRGRGHRRRRYDQQLPGTYGIGYDNSGLASGLIATTVPNTTVSAYTRTSFSLVDAGAMGNLYLGVDYDDGWALWINGTEVARSPNMPAGPLDWNSPAGDHESRATM